MGRSILRWPPLAWARSITLPSRFTSRISAQMQRVYKMIEKVSQHEYPVLILGESGTGKELVAKSIHYSGKRKERPFAPVDCSSLVPTLIESELFAYVKGAFPGDMHYTRG